MDVNLHVTRTCMHITSDFRLSREVRMPRMELSPTSLANSGSWDEYCNKSCSTLTASCTVGRGDCDCVFEKNSRCITKSYRTKNPRPIKWIQAREKNKAKV